MLKTLFAYILLMLACSSANAALLSRAGGLAYYDTVLNITWVANANLAQTQGYDADGKMSWSAAQGWIASLNSANYLGKNDWRLPITTQPDPACANQFNPGGGLPLQGGNLGCTASEMGHLANITGILSSSQTPFNNVQSTDFYWSGTTVAYSTGSAWGVFFLSGFQNGASKGESRYAWAVRTGDTLSATPYNLVGYYHRDESFNPGKLYSMAFKAGAAQGCPGPTYTQPCYNPAGPSPGGTWVAANGVATDIIAAGQPTWTWNGSVLTSTGMFWVTDFVLSNPNGAPLLSDKVIDLTITPSTSTTNAASYECVEGTFYVSVAMSGCKYTVLGSNLLDDSSANWNVGANPKCVTLTIGGDDYSAFDGSPGIPGTPSPRGLTAQAAGQAGVGCAQTSAGPVGASGAFDLWNVIVDDGTNLILANTTNIGACYLFGSGPTPACPDDVALAGISYLVLVKASVPDGDSDGVPDATDNCPAVPNGDQADDDGDLRGNLCDNCRAVANNTGPGAQCDSNGDGYGNYCDADLNNNGSTNAFDAPLYRAQFGQPSVGPTYNIADLNCSGGVNAFDTPIFRSLLGSAPGPSGLACAGTIPCP